MTASPKTGDARIGTLLADRYRIEALLGQGGMGTVYRAEHVHMKRRVAIKLLHSDVASVGDIAARFEREAVAVGRIEHKYVAKALDFGRLPDGAFYFVVEYVQGDPLTALIRRGPVAAKTALEIARQIASAIEAAHRAGVVHRDLKPDNVMLSEPDGTVKVLDFGVAKLVSDDAASSAQVTKYGVIIGTPEYMSPEQAGGGKVDHRADLYALGVILYEMLAGKPPFVAGDRIGLLAQQLVEPPPPLPASIPEPARALVLELLAKDPEARVQSASVLIERIDSALAAADSPESVALGALAVAHTIFEPAPVSNAMNEPPSQARPASLPEPTPVSVAAPRPKPKPRSRALVGTTAIALVAGVAAAIVLVGGKPSTSGATAVNALGAPEPVGTTAAAPPSSVALPESTSEPAPSAAVAETPEPAADAAPSAEPAPAADTETEVVVEEQPADSDEPQVVEAPSEGSAAKAEHRSLPRKTVKPRKGGKKYIIRRRIIRRTYVTR